MLSGRAALVERSPRGSVHRIADGGHEPRRKRITKRLDNQVLFEELAGRRSGGIEVSLVWTRRSGRLTVYVFDKKTNETFELPFTHWEGRTVLRRDEGVQAAAVAAA